MTLEEQLLNRGVTFPAPTKLSEDIINDPVRLAKVGTMCQTYREEFVDIIRARVQPLQEELLYKCLPVETTELRRCIMEIAELINDIDNYVVKLESMRKLEEDIKQKEETVSKDSSQEPEDSPL